MHSPRPLARAGLLAAAAALIAMLVAAPSAGAASFSGGTIKLDFKSLKGVKVTSTGASPKTSTGGTFPFAENAGSATMNNNSSGTLNIGTTSTELVFTMGKKKLTLKSLVEKLAGGKATLNGKVGGKGGSVAMFDQASANRIKGAEPFTELVMSSSKMTLSAKGAAALNKAFGLKAPKRGQKDKRFKKKQAVGTASFTAERQLTVVGGSTKTIYDQKFVQDLRNCDITLSAVAPATAIPKDASAPEGGADLPVDAAAGGILNAKTLDGSVNHQGGTRLDRPAGGPSGKPAYSSPLTNFTFTFSPGNFVLNAFIVNANRAGDIGTVEGTRVANLEAEGGSVSITNGSLVLSVTAAGTLSSNAPPLGADCPIPAGSKIGAINMAATVQ